MSVKYRPVRERREGHATRAAGRTCPLGGTSRSSQFHIVYDFNKPARCVKHCPPASCDDRKETSHSCCWNGRKEKAGGDDRNRYELSPERLCTRGAGCMFYRESSDTLLYVSFLRAGQQLLTGKVLYVAHGLLWFPDAALNLFVGGNFRIYLFFVTVVFHSSYLCVVIDVHRVEKERRRAIVWSRRIERAGD